MTTRMLVIIFFLCGCLSTFFGQQSVPRPNWSKSPPSGGFRATDVAIPPEIAASTHPFAVAQFPARGWRVKAGVAAIRFSPSSGVLQFEDLRSPNVPITGWDTGADRVYSCSLEEDGPTSAKFIVSLWNQSSKTCSVARVVVPLTGALSQASISRSSSVNSVWVGASTAGSDLYVLDFQDMKIVKLVDTVSDGFFDSVDGSFQLSLEVDSSSVDYDERIVSAFPMSRFIRHGAEVVSFVRPRRLKTIGGLRVRVVFGGGQYKLKFSGPPKSELVSLVLTRQIVPGQSRVLCSGYPGAVFSLEVLKSDGTIEVVAVGREIGSDGTAVATANRSFLLGEKVRLRPASSNVPPSSWRDVEGPESCSLFSALELSVFSGKKSTLRGVGLPAKPRGRCEDEAGTIHDVTVKKHSATEFIAVFPDFGNGTLQPPFDKMTVVRFWIGDDTSGAVVSNSVRVYVSHN